MTAAEARGRFQIAALLAAQEGRKCRVRTVRFREVPVRDPAPMPARGGYQVCRPLRKHPASRAGDRGSGQRRCLC